MKEINKHLTDFEEIKESVINLSKVRQVQFPNSGTDNETQQGILYEAIYPTAKEED